MGSAICNGASAGPHDVIPTENGLDGISIGTDSMMMMTDESSGMEVTSWSMQNVIGTVPMNGDTVNGAGLEVATVGSSSLPPHTCYTSRAQLCTMSLQQVKHVTLFLRVYIIIIMLKMFGEHCGDV